MNNPIKTSITGLGVISSIGQGKQAFFESLIEGRSCFDVMSRPGRQFEIPSSNGDSLDREFHQSFFLGSEISEFELSDKLKNNRFRNISLSAKAALVALEEAWSEAELDQVDSARIGLIVGGSNVQQRELMLFQDKYRDKPQFMRPNYALNYMDTDICGVCTEAFGIQGGALSIGGASSSGQMAVIQAVQAVESGQVDVCIALGALMDLSYWECQAFRNIGAMGSDKFVSKAAKACRPFDQQRDGFIFGESCAAIVVERIGLHDRASVKQYAHVSGRAMASDANRNANPSGEGEVKVIQAALAEAGLSASSIDYINPHGTASPLGDKTELEALKACGLSHAHINTTKSIVGHGLSAAGAVEIIATLLQMEQSILHPSLNLDDPIDKAFNWVYSQSERHHMDTALSLSFGFGGFNTAICLQR